jgi:hypothetical protein
MENNTESLSLLEELKGEIQNLVSNLVNEKVFIPTWNNRPEELPAVLMLNGTSILTHQNIAAVIADPGMGKSSLCEAICAVHLNNNIDALGFQGDPDYKGIVYADFERTNLDVWNSFNRMARRAQVPQGCEISNIVIAGMRSVPRLAERMAAIESLLTAHPCSLLLLDGAGDLVTDTNDINQAVECRIWLRELTVKFNLSIFTTIHPNPGTDKPRGHIGSEVVREAECVILAKRTEYDINLLTTDFAHGKNRNNKKFTTAYYWNDEEKMFTATEVPEEYAITNSGKAAGRKKLPDAVEIDKSVHMSALRLAFKHEPQLNEKNFVEAFTSAWRNAEGGSMGASRARLFLKYYIHADMVRLSKSIKNNASIHELIDNDAVF